MTNCSVAGCTRVGSHSVRADALLCCDHFEQYTAGRFNVPPGAIVTSMDMTLSVERYPQMRLTILLTGGAQGERARQAILNPGALMLPEGTTTDVEAIAQIRAAPIAP